MTREEAIKYWEQFDAEIDELATDNLYEEQMDALEKQREVVEFTISALRAQQTIHVTDLYDEDGGEVYQTKQDQSTDSGKMMPLNLDELRQMDAVPVVRCADCENWREHVPEWCGDGFGYCRVCMMDTKKDHFCSYGERKEGAE